jgi:signal transduction histidine kinase/CheY-like chemotaxis protein
MSSNMARDRLAKVFLGGVLMAGVCAVIVSAYRLPVAKFDLQLGLLTLLTVTVTSRIRIGIPRLTSEIGVSDTLIFLILLLYGGEAAVLVATADALIQTSRYGRKLRTFLFNGAMLACSTFLSGEVVHYAFQHFPNLNYEVFTGNYLIMLCVMMLVQYVVNTGLAAIHSYLQTTETLLQTWSKYYLWASITYVAGASCAAITARFINSLGFFTVLVTTPIIAIIFLTYRTYLKNVKTAELQAEQARTHVEELNRYIAQQDRIQQQFSQVEKLSALGQLASGVAHDFNNSLASILGRSELMMKHSDDPKIRRGLEIIAKSARDGAKTVKRIQDFARQRSERDFELVDVDQMLLDVSEITRPRWRDGAEANNIYIQLDLNNHSLAKVNGDVSELRDVLVNLIFNALHAMPNGGNLALAAEIVNNEVILSVSDTGVGMSDEVRSRIFDPFFTTKGVEGMGLGLSVGYGVIRRHQGEFEVKSELGKGSEFRIKLPLAGITDGTQSKPEISEVKIVRRSNMTKILVVDDEEDVRNLLREILEDADCEAVTASHGYDGLKLFAEGQFDAVFTDLGMPGMSGWELARAIREKDSKVPLAIITGWGEAVTAAQKEGAEVNWVLSKPFSMAQIVDIAEEICRGREEMMKSKTRLTLVA